MPEGACADPKAAKLTLTSASVPVPGPILHTCRVCSLRVESFLVVVRVLHAFFSLSLQETRRVGAQQDGGDQSNT